MNSRYFNPPGGMGTQDDVFGGYGGYGNNGYATGGYGAGTGPIDSFYGGGGGVTGGGSPTPIPAVMPGGATLPNESGGVQTYTPTQQEIDDQRRQEAMNRFYQSPDYDFRMNEGIRAMDSSAASRGMLMSGAQLRGITEFGQGLAAGEYGNYYNRLAGIAGLAKTAQNPYAGAQSSLYGGLMNSYGQAGANTANIYGNQANANAGIWGNALGGIDWSGVGNAVGGMFKGGNPQGIGPSGGKMF